MALPVPGSAAAQLSASLRPLQLRFRHVRWLPPDSLHLTVLFLGATASERVQDVAAHLDATAAGHSAYEIRTDGGGGRVGQSGRGGLGVAWLSLDRGADETAALATDLGARLESGTAWPAKGHAPHLTIARRASRDLVNALRDPNAVPPVGWQCDEMVLFSSELGLGAPRYDVLHRAALGVDAGPEQP